MQPLLICQEIRRYIAQDDPGASQKFVGEILKRCESLADMPHMGRERAELRDGLRALPFRDYLIFYRIISDTVEVLRVIHDARDIERLL